MFLFLPSVTPQQPANPAEPKKGQPSSQVFIFTVRKYKMRLVSTKHLFLTTRNRNAGSIDDSIYKLPPGSLTCGEGEVFRICLARLAFFNDIYNVNESNNVLCFRKVNKHDHDCDTVTRKLPFHRQFHHARLSHKSAVRQCHCHLQQRDKQAHIHLHIASRT